MRGHARRWMAVLLAPAAFMAVSAAATSAGAKTLKIQIGACLNGAYELTIRGNEMVWNTLNGTPVGQTARASDCRQAATATTVTSWDDLGPSISSWNPVYIGTTSTVFSGLTNPLPGASDGAFDVSLTRKLGRGAISWVQKPDSTNDYTAKISFRDPGPGADWYTAELVFTYPGQQTAAASVPDTTP